MTEGTSRVTDAPQLARKPIPAILALSVGVAAFLVWLIYFKGKVAAPDWVGFLPGANALFNSLSAICLVCGYLNIRGGRRLVHMRFMLSATFFQRFSCSATSLTTTFMATQNFPATAGCGLFTSFF